MLTTSQLNIIKSISVPIRYTNSNTLGYITKIPEVYINISYNVKKYLHVHDMILLHEVGHAYFNHILLNWTSCVDYVIQVAEDLGVDIEYKDIHRIINIAMDMQINSSLMEPEQVDLIKRLNGAHPDLIGAKSGLNWKEYIEPLLLHYSLINLIKLISQLSESELNSLGLSDDSESEAASLIQDTGYSNLGSGEIHKELTEPYTLDEFDDILSKLLKVNKNRCTILNTEKHQKRRDRVNSNNLIYNGYDRKIKKSLTVHKYWIIIDVSGSMRDNTVKTILSSLYEFRHRFDPQSQVLLYSNHLHHKIKITDKLVNYNSGLGTNLSPAISMGLKSGYRDILLISDFYDDDKLMHEVCTKCKCNYTLINVLDRDNFDEVDRSMPNSIKLFKRFNLLVPE